jgi:hypothetical protein
MAKREQGECSGVKSRQAQNPASAFFAAPPAQDYEALISAIRTIAKDAAAQVKRPTWIMQSFCMTNAAFRSELIRADLHVWRVFDECNESAEICASCGNTDCDFGARRRLWRVVRAAEVAGGERSCNLAETVHRMAGSVELFRASFAAYLVEATCDIALTMLFYVLLRPVNRNLSLLAAFFGLVSTAVFAAGEIFYFSAALPVVDADVARVISPDAKAALTYLCLTIFGYVFGAFAALYGTAVAVRGYLIARSSFLPRWVGVIVILGGLSFVAESIVIVFAPRFNVPYLLAPMMLAMACLALWLLIKGVDPVRWDETQLRNQPANP